MENFIFCAVNFGSSLKFHLTSTKLQTGLGFNGATFISYLTLFEVIRIFRYSVHSNYR